MQKQVMPRFFSGVAEDDIATALETIEERCRLAFIGVPSETRKSFANGTTMFERVLPGADRMYPDTDSAPISITQELIDIAGSNLPIDVKDQITKLENWNSTSRCFFLSTQVQSGSSYTADL